MVGYVALFFAMSLGTAYATHPGGLNTISSGDIINDEVRSSDLGDGDVYAVDVRNDNLVAGGLGQQDLRTGSIGSPEIQFTAVNASEIGEAIHAHGGDPVDVTGPFPTDWQDAVATASCHGDEEVITGYGEWPGSEDEAAAIKEIRVDYSAESVSVDAATEESNEDFRAIAVCWSAI